MDAFRRDRVGIVSSRVAGSFVPLALAAPLITAPDGTIPTEHYGRNGISAEHWFGIEPGLGRDALAQFLYSIRTSAGPAPSPATSCSRSRPCCS
ncbi:hypothetical protein HHL19_22725 [Streptomyces sp. R302]|uniref:hypothetical protein n=1 Tax=unclassified Streptomyces TaxID=2593676 RepID=UPI00145E71B7|nr:MULTISPECIES: hypothetical protein [unclassified Streptomyces]NML51767.1 hypothetical protein [Streptomyces sp. R301]NML81387.1 hypothetical protein [Streptomyces sp. R302]